MTAVDLIVIMMGVLLFILLGKFQYDQIRENAGIPSTKTVLNQKIKNRLDYYIDDRHICPGCGCELTHETVFCPKCNTITPRVRDVLTSYPDKNPTDYRSYSTEDGYTCPICNRHNISIEKAYLVTPILCCPHCYGYFLDPGIFESYGNASPSLFKSITSSFFPAVFFTYFVWCIWEPPAPVLIALLCIAVALLTVRSIFSDKKHSANSAARFKHNPDYPQILADMGYLHQLPPQLRANLKKYGPNGEVRCEYCNKLSITEDSHCPHCAAPLPKQRYFSTTASFSPATLMTAFSPTYRKKLGLVILLAFITALLIWALL